jgi:hypothetical protein
MSEHLFVTLRIEWIHQGLLTIVWCKASGGDERLVRSRRGF